MLKTHKITQQQIAEKFEVTQRFVSMAIRGERNSKKAREIRRAYGENLMRIGANLKTAAGAERLAA